MNKNTHQPRRHAAAPDPDLGLDRLQQLWDCRSDCLDSLLTTHQPLAQPAAAAAFRQYEARAARFRYAAVAGLFLAIITPSTLSAQELKTRHPSDVHYNYLHTIANLNNALNNK